MQASPGSSNRAYDSVDALWHARPSRVPVSDAIHATLREAIVQGLLAPGYRLNETALADRFHVSRTPVREALLRLESERLLGRDRRGGLVVAEVTAKEIVEVYAVREVLTGLIAGLAAEFATEADIVALRRGLEALRRAAASRDYPLMSEINLRFHETLCRATRNDFLLYLTQQVDDRLRRFPGTTLSYPGRAASMLEAHEALIGAIERRDAELASSLAQQRMAGAREVRILMLQDVSAGSPDEDGRFEYSGSQGRVRADPLDAVSHGPPVAPLAD